MNRPRARRPRWGPAPVAPAVPWPAGWSASLMLVTLMLLGYRLHTPLGVVAGQPVRDWRGLLETTSDAEPDPDALLHAQAEDDDDQEPGGVGNEENEQPDAERRIPTWQLMPFRVGVSRAAHKRALSVLSRFTPFTSLGTRRMGRYPSRPRAPSMPRDYISAETRGDFSDRPSGQPLRWG